MKIDREKFANAAAYLDAVGEQQLQDLDLSEFFDPDIQYEFMDYHVWIERNKNIPPTQFLLDNVHLWRR